MIPIQKDSNRQKAPMHYKRLGIEFAMQFLFQNDMSKLTLPQALEAFWEQAEASGAFADPKSFRRGKRYAVKIIEGAVANLEQIDRVIVEFSDKWDIKRMACVDRNILRVAVYEMQFCPDIPPVVSIDEAVGIAKEFSSEKAGTFINGILNGIKDSLDRPPREAVEKI